MNKLLPQSSNITMRKTTTKKVPSQNNIDLNEISSPKIGNSTGRDIYNINVLTNNSFDSLPDSEEDADRDSSLASSSLLITKQNSSCPELNDFVNGKIDILNKKIDDLQMKLQSAENEIENLLSENCCLKSKLEKYSNKINNLEQICKSITKQTNTERKQNSLRKSRLYFSPVPGENQHKPSSVPLNLSIDENSNNAVSVRDYQPTQHAPVEPHSQTLFPEEHSPLKSCKTNELKTRKNKICIPTQC